MEIMIKPSFLTTGMILIAIWTIPWKGMALWRSAKKGDRIWFIVLLILNTLAILEILYIFVFSKKDDQSQIIKVEAK